MSADLSAKNGYSSALEDTGNLHGYLTNPAAPLETTEFVDYGAVMLWGTWLYERFGADFVRALVAAPANGRQGLDAAWATTGQAVTYEETFADWALANVVDGPPAPSNVEGGALGYQLLALPHFQANGALPALVQGQASGSITVPPSSFRWLQGTVATPGDLAVSIPDDAPVGLRVASYIEGASVAATEVDAATWTVAAETLADPVVVVIANPTLTAQTVTVSFSQLLARPEPEDDAGPLPEVVEVIEPEPQPDTTGADTAVPLADLASSDVPGDDVPSDDVGAAETDDSAGGGSCTFEAFGNPGALPLLLSALALVLAHRRRRS